MTITGYGEDALNYWALSNRLEQVTGRPIESDTVVLFRPSFGRRSSPPDDVTRRAKRSEFGEFDAIISTSSMVHLIEAKWDSSLESAAGTITLGDEQLRRHQIFRAYLDARWKSTDDGRASFCARDGVYLNTECGEYPIPGRDTKLAANLGAILGKIGATRKGVRNVLLYLQLKEEKEMTLNPPAGFDLVTIRTESPTGFVDLPSVPRLTPAT